MSVAWALNVWATNSWLGMNGGPPNAWRGGTTPPPAVITNTPGFRIPGQVRGETAEAKRERRIREGTIAAERPQEPVQADASAEYVRRSAKLARTLQRLASERQGLQDRIATLEAAKTVRAEKQLLKQRQALQMAAIQEAIVLEQMEVLDVAFVAAAVLTLQ